MTKNKKDENIIDIGGVMFILDIDKYSEVLTNIDDNKMAKEIETNVDYDEDKKPISTNVSTREYEKGMELDAPKYDVLRMCLEIILNYHDEIDDSLGLDRALSKTTIPFKIAYNTLINYGILKEI